MALTPRIAIDAMGGDVGVRMMLAGAAMARHKHDGLRFILVGDEVQIKAALDNHPNLRAASDIIALFHGGSNTSSTSASAMVGTRSTLVRTSSTRMSPMPQPGAVRVILTSARR